jgi:hypothetical protein
LKSDPAGTRPYRNGIASMTPFVARCSLIRAGSAFSSKMPRSGCMVFMFTGSQLALQLCPNGRTDSITHQFSNRTQRRRWGLSLDHTPKLLAPNTCYI